MKRTAKTRSIKKLSRTQLRLLRRQHQAWRKVIQPLLDKVDESQGMKQPPFPC